MKILKKLLCLLFVFFLVGCSNEKIYLYENETRKYSDYTINQITTEDMFSINERGAYFVYYYSESCKQCENIKSLIFDHMDYNKLHTTAPKMLLLDGSNEAIKNSFATNSSLNNRQRIDKSIGAKSISEIYHIGYPSLFVIENKTLTKYIVGASNVASFVDDTFDERFLNTNEKRTYQDEKYKGYFRKIDDIFNNIEDNEYYAYFYRDNCSFCNNIKTTVLDVLDKNETSSIKLYLIDVLQENDTENFRTKFKENTLGTFNEKLRNECIGKSKISDIYFFGTPCLFQIKNNKLVSYRVDYLEVAGELL